MDATATMEKPPEDKVLAILQTRCGCERTVETPAPPPKTVTVELAPLYKGADKEVRVFFLKAQAKHPSVQGDIYLYQEGESPDKPRIVVPGMPMPKRLA